jgi:L-threonylcarbamoyladenylate synthase
METNIQQAIEVLKQGGIVIFPTDTAFGIGCRIDKEESVKKLFRLRKRPEDKAVPVLVDTVTMAQRYLQPIPQEVIDRLIEPYWPGALTIVLNCKKDQVPSLVRGGGETIGVRIPKHTIARTLIREVGIPILGPSANFAGEATPYRFEDLNPDLTKLVDYVVPGDTSGDNTASTVMDCTTTPWKILRQGAITV